MKELAALAAIIAQMTDAQLAAFITESRQAYPNNTKKGAAQNEH